LKEKKEGKKKRNERKKRFIEDHNIYIRVRIKVKPTTKNIFPPFFSLNICFWGLENLEPR